MQIKPEQLEAQLAKGAAGLKPLYTLHGDEPLLVQEAADAIRAAARAAGYGERKVFTVSGAHFDWSAVQGAAQSMSLFAERQLIEIRIPSGKPGKDGGEALQRYCEALSDDVLTLVQLPRLDFQQSKSAWFNALDGAGVVVRLDPIERRALPAWLAQRLARQGQRVAEGEEGQRTLAFFADRVEGNLLAAHQEMQKMALLHPTGTLRFAQVEAAVIDVARYDIAKLVEAVWAGQGARALRMLAALEAEGESAVFVHWSLAEDVRALARARAAIDAGQPLPLALREARVWGAKEKLFERALPQLGAAQLARWLHAAQVCDGQCKGLLDPRWPSGAWPALRQLVLLLLGSPQGATRPLALHA
ncbi:MAG: DNA polymerase III subunit delta [Burkholderiales bacterium]|nr:DNA polymerase III subunit delta [Burkholderiales bacterium]